MRKIGIYLSVLVLLLASCKNDTEILRNMKPLEQYYKKYTVQQLVEKIMKDKGAKSVGIHFDVFEQNENDSGVCLFTGSLIFNEGNESGYGKLKEDCGLDSKKESYIKYMSDGTVVKANGETPTLFTKIIFLFETMELRLDDFKVQKIKRNIEKGDEQVYFIVESDFQKKIMSTNFPKLINEYSADHLLIAKYGNSYELSISFLTANQKYGYYESITWRNEVQADAQLNFEKEKE